MSGFSDGKCSNETPFSLKRDFHDDNTWMLLKNVFAWGNEKIVG